METLFPSPNGAHFSPCRQYRYALWRIWDAQKPYVMFVGLNPSTANETEPDPTITRVINMARRWGYGGVYMMNCFAWVSTNPGHLQGRGNDQVNDEWLWRIGSAAGMVVFAWGTFKVVKEQQREAVLRAMFPAAMALVLNKDGSPRHPLYVPTATVPVPFVNPGQVTGHQHTTMSQVNKPTPGRIVTYVWPEDDNRASNNNGAATSPAIVSRVFEPAPGQYTLNLKVQGDGTDTPWVTSVPYDETGKLPNTWHWPERNQN